MSDKPEKEPKKQVQVDYYVHKSIRLIGVEYDKGNDEVIEKAIKALNFAIRRSQEEITDADFLEGINQIIAALEDRTIRKRKSSIPFIQGINPIGDSNPTND